MTIPESYLGQAVRTISFNDAKDKFWFKPTAANAAATLRIALKDWTDRLITDDGLFEIIDLIAHRKNEERRIGH